MPKTAKAAKTKKPTPFCYVEVSYSNKWSREMRERDKLIFDAAGRTSDFSGVDLKSPGDRDVGFDCSTLTYASALVEKMMPLVLNGTISQVRLKVTRREGVRAGSW